MFSSTPYDVFAYPTGLQHHCYTNLRDITQTIHPSQRVSLRGPHPLCGGSDNRLTVGREFHLQSISWCKSISRMTRAWLDSEDCHRDRDWPARAGLFLLAAWAVSDVLTELTASAAAQHGRRWTGQCAGRNGTWTSGRIARFQVIPPVVFNISSPISIIAVLNCLRLKFSSV
jgi:hypothetical protein